MKKGWDTSTLGECCQIKPPKKEARVLLSPSDMVSFVPMSDLGIRVKALKAAEDRPLESVSGNYTYFADGDVLLAKITPCFENGKLGIASGLTNGIGFGSSEFIVLRPADGLNAEYLFYFLSQDSFRDAGASVMSGAVGHKRLPKDFIQKLQIPLPSLPEQKRIVIILDESIAEIDTAIANTEKNLANARELFESYLNSVFSQSSEDWVEKRLDAICSFSSGGTPSKLTSNYWDGEIPWISGRDMKATQLSDSLLHITQTAIDESATRLAPAGSLLVLVRGMGLAHGAQVAELMTPSAFNQDIKGVHPIPELVSRYLVFVLRHCINASDNVLSNAAHGTLKIDMEMLKGVMITFPSFEKQRIIVAQIDGLIDATQRLESIYQQKLAALTELKQSLLQKAFSGELTANNVVPITSSNKKDASLKIDSPAFAAQLMATAYHRHESKRRDKTFGRVKAQKTLHLVEALAQIDLGRSPVKDAAGPNDSAHMKKAEQWATDNNFYEFVQRPEKPLGYDFVKGKRYEEWLPRALEATEPYQKTLDRVVRLLMPLTTKEAELVATAFAAWNNLLLDGAEPTEEAIIFEARDNWHRDKQRYSKQQFRAAINRLRSHGMVPNGSGKRVTGQSSLL